MVGRKWVKLLEGLGFLQSPLGGKRSQGSADKGRRKGAI